MCADCVSRMRSPNTIDRIPYQEDMHADAAYERRSLRISSNLVFSQWDQIFKDPLTTMAAIDRLVHHSIILEFDGASQRVKRAGENVGEKTPKPES